MSLKDNDSHRLAFVGLVVEALLDRLDDLFYLSAVDDPLALSFTESLVHESGPQRLKPVGRSLAQGNQRGVRITQLVAEANDLRYATEVFSKRDQVPKSPLGVIEEACIGPKFVAESELAEMVAG